MGMKTRRLVVLTLLSCFLSGAISSAALAQKNVSKVLPSITSKAIRYVPPQAGQAATRVGVLRPFTPSLLSPQAAAGQTPASGVPVISAEQVQSAASRSLVSHRKNKKWMTINPRDKAEQLLNQTGNPITALQSLWRLKKYYQNRSFFSFLATAYYKQNFNSLTPHLREFFKKVERTDDYKLQYRVLKRMSFIIKNQDKFRAYFAPNIPKFGMRLRYTKDIARLTPENYSPRSLVLSFERKMNPGQSNASIRHVKVKSRFQVGKTDSYPVYRYNGPLEFMPNLYTFLVNGTHPKNHMTVIFDRDSRSMAIYNEDRSLWLRITPHEYAAADNLHLHLNETRTAQLEGILGRTIEETVNFNLFIPLEKPQALPSHNQQDYLYEMMILRPIRYFRGNAHVTIIERPIF